MKKTIAILMAILFYTAISFAQTPNAFKYQAVARNAQNELLDNQTIGIRFSIKKNNINGTTVYLEQYIAQTNSYGQFELNVGQGNSILGDFNMIQWGNDSYFLNVEMDVDGQSGNQDFLPMGVSQILAVPYALHAATVENDKINDADADPNNELILSAELNGNILEITDAGGTTDVDLSDLSGNIVANDYEVGDLAHGGIVFWVDETGVHGLVVSPSNLTFDPISYRASDPKGDGIYAGRRNTNHNLTQCQFGDWASCPSSILLCPEYQGGNFGDWYLPSKYELNLIYTNLKLNGIGNLGNFNYWSSTGVVDAAVWFQNFGNGVTDFSFNLSTLGHIRAVRAF